jgi:hypothetical protein
MLAMPFEKIAAAEAMELACTLAADTPQTAAVGSDEWLQAQTPAHMHFSPSATSSRGTLIQLCFA